MQRYKTTLGSIAEIFDGPHATPKVTSHGPVFLGISNLSHGRLDLENTKHVSEHDYVRWTRRVTPTAGDIVFSYETRLGEAALVPGDLRCCLGRRMGLIRPHRNLVDSRFLLYYYLGPQFQETIRKYTVHGSTVDRIPLVDMPGFEVCIPDLAHQKRIGAILGSLDDKIDLNRRTNDTLEAIARTLFKSWFVDFDPVHAKAKGKDLVGMDAETAALFPSEFEDSAMGPIPKGWRASTLGDEVGRRGGIVQTGPFGSQLHASDYVEEGVPVIMPRDIIRRRVATSSIARIREEDADRLAKHRVREGDLVYSRRGDVERHALIGNREVGWLCGTGCLLVRPGEQAPSSAFLSLFLDRPESRAWLTQHAVGATMANLNTSILSAVPLLAPSDDIVAAFDAHVESWAKRMVSSEAESRTLAAIRDTLLPRLISGEISLDRMEGAGGTP